MFNSWHSSAYTRMYSMKAWQGCSSVRSKKGFFIPNKTGLGKVLRRYWAPAQSTCCTGPNHKHCPPTPCFVIEYIKPPVYGGGGGGGGSSPSFVYTIVPSLWAAAHRPCQIEQELIIFFNNYGSRESTYGYGLWRTLFISEVGSASFFGGALSAGPLPFYLCALALIRCHFNYATALCAIRL